MIKIQGRCFIESCKNQRQGDRFCEVHYSRYKKYVEKDINKLPDMYKECSVDMCTALITTRGLCQTHFRRAQRGSPIGTHKVQKKGETPICQIDGCDKTHAARGLCSTHYATFSRHGLSISLINSLPKICEFCSSAEDLNIDHDHSCCPRNEKLCGKCARRVLCRKCNAGIGMLGDDPELYLTIARSLMINPNPRLFAPKANG